MEEEMRDEKGEESDDRENYIVAAIIYVFSI